jgi:hypothetical protein
MRCKGNFRLREKVILRNQKCRLTNVSKSILTWSSPLLRIEGRVRKNLKKEFKNSGFKACRFILVLRKKCKMISKIYKNAMKK